MTTRGRKEVLKQQTFAKFPYLIEITYKDEEGELHHDYFINQDYDVTYNSHEYKACVFSVQPATKSNSGVSDGKISFSTVDLEWIERVRKAVSRIKLSFVACIDYSAEDSENPIEEIERTEYMLINANWNDTEIEFTMMFDDRMNLNFPCVYGGNAHNPALV